MFSERLNHFLQLVKMPVMEHLVRGRAVNRYLNTSRVLHHRLKAWALILVGRLSRIMRRACPLPAFIALFDELTRILRRKNIFEILYLEVSICKTGMFGEIFYDIISSLYFLEKARH